MKTIKLALCLLSIVAIFPIFTANSEDKAPAPPTVSAPPPNPDAIVAVVDGKNITSAEIQAEMKKRPGMAQQLGMQKDPAFAKQMQMSILNNIIDRKILLTAAQKEGSPLADAEVEAQAQAIYAQAGGKEGFEKQLTMMGLSPSDFRQELSENMVISKYLEQSLSKDTTVSEAEIKKYFDENKEKLAEQGQVKARHILLKVEDKTKTEEDAAAKKKMAEIRTEALAPGADFGALAMKYSQCPSAPKGGDLGFFKKGQMVPPFENAAFDAKVGDVTEIVETQFGYHIIKVEERKEGGPADFEKSKERIKNTLESQRRSTAVQSKIESLRGASSVEIKL